MLFVVSAVAVTGENIAATQAPQQASPQTLQQPLPQAQQPLTQAYSVASINTVVHDKRRNKDLALRVNYPDVKDAQVLKTFPVIIFSHGLGGSKDTYQYLTRYWAGNGYVVIQPTHDDTLSGVMSVNGALKKMAQGLKTIMFDYPAWENRCLDVKLILDKLPNIQEKIPAQIDMSTIGLGGHSYGAWTSSLMGGTAIPAAANNDVHDCTDARIKAFMPISPQGIRKDPKDFGFDDANSWRNVTGPTFYITGTKDQTGWITPEQRKGSYINSPPGDKYFVTIDGANHMTFSAREPGALSRTAARTAISGTGTIAAPLRTRSANPAHEKKRAAFRKRFEEQFRDTLSQRFGAMEVGDRQQMLDAIKVTSLAFWNAYLKGDEKDKQALKSGTIKALNPLIMIESK